MQKPVKIEISSKTIIFTVLFLVFLKFLWIVRDLLFSLLIAFIIMSAARPAVLYLEKKKIPRSVSAVVLFILFLVFIVYILMGTINPIVYETSQLIKSLPIILYQINPSLAGELNFNSLSQYIPNLTNQASKIAGAVFSNIIFLFSTLFFGLYFSIEENLIKKLLMRFFDEKKAERVALIFEKVEKRLSAWFWGELVLMLVVGILTFIGLNLIGLKYTIPLAIIAGLLEVVPNLGPIISTVPAILVALTQNYFLTPVVIALYFIIQQLENNLIVPWVMKKAVNINPILTLVALMVGGKIGGILGVLLAIPITLFIETVLVEIFQTKNNN